MKTYIVHWQSKTIPAHSGVATVKAKNAKAARAKTERKFAANVLFVV